MKTAARTVALLHWLSHRYALIAIPTAFVALAAAMFACTLHDRELQRSESCSESTVLPMDSAGVDVARKNLQCAQGLPGTEALEIAKTLVTLERWAARITSETEKYLWKFNANPGDFNRSEGYFRTLTLVTVLQQDFGVHYNPERVRSPNFADSRDLFLHGLVTGKREGTCVSMPVLYVAVGRRLGYPLKLVTAKGHLFARWEGRRTERLTSPQLPPLSNGAERGQKEREVGAYERFNIEATGQGLSCFPDEYYHTWPEPLTPKEITSGQYLKSLTSEEEHAVFLSARGNCLEANGRYAEARQAYAEAYRRASNTTLYAALVNRATSKLSTDPTAEGLAFGNGAKSSPASTTP